VPGSDEIAHGIGQVQLALALTAKNRPSAGQSRSAWKT
jgi:hypothetical protein